MDSQVDSNESEKSITLDAPSTPNKIFPGNNLLAPTTSNTIFQIIIYWLQVHQITYFRKII